MARPTWDILTPKEIRRELYIELSKFGDRDYLHAVVRALPTSEAEQLIGILRKIGTRKEINPVEGEQ